MEASTAELTELLRTAHNAHYNARTIYLRRLHQAMGEGWSTWQIASALLDGTDSQLDIDRDIKCLLSEDVVS